MNVSGTTETATAARRAQRPVSFVVRLRRLNRVYWRSPAGRKGIALLAGAVALELGVVWLTVKLAGAQRLVFDAIQEKDSDAFFAGAGYFFGITLFFVLASAYRVYVRQCLEIDWRRHVTADYVSRWIGPEAYRQREVDPGATDNPDQRIAEDVRNFVSSSLGLGLSLLAAVATLVSFSGLLWSLSADWPLAIGQRSIHIPGLMLWVALLYALFAMALTHLVGRPLVPINFQRQRVEADFRYSLVRFRENVEAVALARGADFEQRGALERFTFVMTNWWKLIGAQRNLLLTTTALGQANAVLPLLLAAPAYFAGLMTLGSVVQTRTAYAQVSGALAWFMFAYQEIAAWRASAERLSTFAEAVDATEADLVRSDRIQVTASGDDAMHIRDLTLETPDGRRILESVSVTVPAGSRLCVVGSAGAGKTTLFRALAGIWPFGSGSVAMPAGSRSIFLPQRPYLPMGTLREVATYPEASGRFDDERIRSALDAVGLAALGRRLDEEADWEQVLSGDEEQRLSLARVFLQEPDWIFLDDATAALEEETEARIYDALATRLPHSTIVTMTRRAGLAKLHGQAWTLQSRADGPAVLVTG